MLGRIIVLLVGLTCNLGVGQAQTLRHWQDSLKRIADEVQRTTSDPEKIQANGRLVKTLVAALKTTHSFDFPFDQLDFVRVVQPEDGKFRVFSWALPLSDGSYLFYGAIQLNTPDGSLRLTPLLDKTFEIENPEEAVLTPDNWYGAVYYDIAPVGGGYVLLGWKGHGREVHKKVIEPITVEQGGIRLGATIFSGTPVATREIFSFQSRATMYLHYFPNSDSLVFDHIVPFDANYEGDFRYYGPDLSFDAYRIRGNKLVKEENIPFELPARGEEDSFLDPRSNKSNKKSGF